MRDGELKERIGGRNGGLYFASFTPLFLPLFLLHIHLHPVNIRELIVVNE